LIEREPVRRVNPRNAASSQARYFTFTGTMKKRRI
jgi:hypothetical protein